MWDKSVRPRTFAAMISSFIVLAGLALLLFYFATNSSATLATDQDTENDLSTATDNTDNNEAASPTIVSAPTTGLPKNSKKNEVIFIGDSLLAQTGTANQLVPKLVADDWQQISINAQGCRANHIGFETCGTVTHFTTMLKEIENSSYDIYATGTVVPGLTQDILKQLYANDQSTLSKISDNTLNESFRQADTVVVSLGTNDDADAEQIEAGIRLTTSSIRALNPGINIYWVKMCAQGNLTFSGSIFNPVVEELSQELEFALIDWASKCEASHQFDGVHYNDQGVEAFTDVLADGIR